MSQPVTWRRRRPFIDQDMEMDAVSVPRAYLTRFETDRLNTRGRPNRWVTGAAYDDARTLVAASQRMRGPRAGDFTVAADRRVLPRLERIEIDPVDLAGHWLYGGNWMGIFGHFITETLPTLWTGRPDACSGLLFHRWTTSVVILNWQRELLEAAGLGGLPIEVVSDRRVRVERLTVPTRPFQVGAFAAPEAVGVWRAVAGALSSRGESRAVYLSRTRHNIDRRAAGKSSRSRLEHDLEADATFAAAGFDVVFPEELRIAEQIDLVSTATVLAGSAGSALHLAAFALAPTKVIELGDERTPHQPLGGQRIIDAACGHESAFVPFGMPLDRALHDLGLSPRTPTRPRWSGAPGRGRDQPFGRLSRTRRPPADGPGGSTGGGAEEATP